MGLKCYKVVVQVFSIAKKGSFFWLCGCGAVKQFDTVLPSDSPDGVTLSHCYYHRKGIY